MTTKPRTPPPAGGKQRGSIERNPALVDADRSIVKNERRKAPRKTAGDGKVPTRERILRSAIHHLAEHGYEGARMRKILVDQGMNVSIAHYYFGSKQKLYAAAMHYYLDIVLQRRREGLENWRKEKGSAKQRVFSLMVQYTLPHFLICGEEGGLDYARLALRTLFSWDRLTQELTVPVTELRRLFTEHLREVLPNVPYSLLERAMRGLAVLMLVESVSHATKLQDRSLRVRIRESHEHAQYCAKIIGGGLLEMTRMNGRA